MSIVVMLGGVILGLSILALYAKQVRKVDLGLFVRQSHKLMMVLSSLLVPALLVLSACQIAAD